MKGQRPQGLLKAFQAKCISLVNHLITHNHPVTLIVDTSTDSTNRNFFIYIRSIEHNKPQTYFYKVIQLKMEL